MGRVEGVGEGRRSQEGWKESGRVEVIIFVGLACLLVQVLMGSGDGVVKLFDSSTSKYHWEVNSDPKYPKYASDILVPRLTFSFHSVLHEKACISGSH